jgi:tetratricopeptide (TPR) repeat protein
MATNPPEIEAMVGLYESGDYAAALERVDTFLVGEPAMSMAWRFKASCLKKLERWAESIPCWQKAADLGGKAGLDALLEKSIAQWNAGKHDDARATLEGVLDNEGGKHGEDVLMRAEQLLGVMLAGSAPK